MPVDPEQLPARLLDLPHALDAPAALGERLAGRNPAVFLDYDGTLTPIVDDPAAATMSDEMRRAVHDLSTRVPVAIVSGRDRADVERFVALDSLVYAGSHGFDIAGPRLRREHEGGAAARPLLVDAADRLEVSLRGIPGALVERKRYAVAVHFRQVDPSLVDQVSASVDAVVAAHPQLRRTTGKMVFELRPDLPWDKGRALEFLMDRLSLDATTVAPVYIGDDDTDEDALVVVRDRGLGIIVGTEDRPTAAHFRLDDPSQTLTLLERFADLVSGAEDED